MDSDQREAHRVTRRKVLALAGVVSISAISGGTNVLTAQPSDPRDSDSDAGNDSTGSGDGDSNSGTQDTAAIRDFGAIEGKDTQSAAKRNTEAIRSAAREAGEGGTIYVSGGEYFFGDANDNTQFRFGRNEPPGISFVGDGPFRSKLTLTSTIEPDRGYRGARYYAEDADGVTLDHGSVTVSDICFDGNYEKLDMNTGTTVWGFVVNGDGEFTLENAWIRGWWASAGRFTGPSVEVRNSTFQENAIGVAQVHTNPTVGHHLVARPAADNSMVVEDSKFLRCSGSVINRSSGDGLVVLRRVFIRGVGNSCMKLSETEGTTRVENVHFKGETDWMVNNLPTDLDLDGRWFIHRITGAEYTPTVVLNNVMITDIPWAAIMCFRDTGLFLKGDMMAIHNAGIEKEGSSTIRGDSGIDFDIGTMSVHNTDGVVFDAPGSTGRIENLFRNGNTGLGEVGNVSIGDHPNSEPVEPDLVERNDIGIRSRHGPYN